MTSNTLSLSILDSLPPGLLDTDAPDLHRVLAGPTLLRLKGRTDQVLFVSVLLHGNETTGWDAARDILKKYSTGLLPRSLYLFIGNVEAARAGQRRLDEQPDYNRIWKLDQDNAETKVARQLLKAVSSQELFAAIDIHNNTGLNPHYACINRLDRDFLYLATLFGRTVVYFLNPDSVLSRAMSKYCPSVTVECGKAEDARGMVHAIEYIDACLHMEHFPQHELPTRDIDLFHTVATVKIPGHLNFGFDEQGTDINFIAEIEKMNFRELSTDITLGTVHCDESPCLYAINEQGENVTERYFRNDNGELKLSVPLMPSMLTMNKDIIRQDCFCYLMERLDQPFISSSEAGNQ